MPSAQVIFDDDPAPKDHVAALQNIEMSNALIKCFIKLTILILKLFLLIFY
jgi:hypothetical protein